MADSSASPVLNAMLEEFGDNAPFALDLYARYRLDPSLVEEGWRRAFRELEERVPFAMSVPARAIAPEAALALVEPATTVSPAAPASAAAPPAAPAQTAASRPAPPPARAGEEAVPIAGGAATIARNMEASLAVPTATSNRVVPVKNMEENRRILNRHREALGLSKVSFTHFVAWAIVRALEKHPGMNDAYGEADGRPMRIRKKAVNLGVAIDVTKRDGSRSLLVPNIKDAGKMTFAGFLDAFDVLVAKARKGAIEPDLFAGTTISLTNPGTLGTTASAPRLMPGQGTIVATGAMGYPAEFQAMPDEVMSALGVSRVMNVSSTYDHRIIQGAESGQFLATLQDLLLGGDRFYDRIFEDLRVPHRPMRWEKDASSPFFGGTNRLEAVEKQARVLQLINAYRVRGHLVADVNPLGVDAVPYHPDLDPATYGFTLWDLDRPFITNGLAGRDHATLREILEVLRQTYCGKIGAEFMYNQDTAQKQWLIERMEGSRNRANLAREDRRRILNALVKAESFEKFLHTKYVGQKRFSLEGGEAAIPLLDRLLDRAAEADLGEAVIGMSHRGRLTVLVNTVGKPAGQIFAEFEGQVDPGTVQGSGDVKYHLGAVGTHVAPGGQRLGVALAPNPSHLEFVDPVVEGMVRAKQTALGDQRVHAKVLPVLLHGDAAFAGQGIVAETLNMSQLHGYRTGGTVHVVVNNQIGFTTNPADARSSPYCTDVAKMVQAPVFHVNGDDPEAVVHAVDVASEYRNTFRRDVVIDLVCYRRYGHNEGDEPSYTQPLMYQKIKGHTSVARLYGAALVTQGVFSQGEVDQMWAEAKTALDRAYDEARGGVKSSFDSLAAAPAKRLKPEGSVRDRLARVARAVSTVPEGFEVHPKLRSILKKRSEYASGRPDIDWAGGEMLAFGMLLLDGTPVRLSGPGLGPRDVQPAPLGLRRHRHRGGVDAAQHDRARAGGVRGHRQPPLGERRHGLRVRVRGGGSVDARPVGRAVRRLRERRAGHHRPVHLGLGAEVEPALRAGAAAAARAGRAGPRALLGAPRALPDALRRGQHARRERVDAGAVLPPAPAPDGGRREEAPRRHDAEEPAAAPEGRVDARRARGRGVPSRARRPRGAVARPPRDPRERQGRLGSHRGAREGGQERRRDRASRAVLPVPGPRARGCPPALPAGGRARLGAGGAAQHGRVALRARAAPRRHGRGPRRPAARCATSDGASSRARRPARTTRSRTSRSSSWPRR